MKKHLHRLSHQLKTGGVLRTLSRSRLFRDACDRYGLVYFGSVSADDDEHTMVRGLTVSAAAVDRHYCVGSVEGYEVILLERSDQLHFPYKQPESYRWIILQVDVDRVTLPHVFLDAHHHQTVFYQVFSAKYPHIQRNDASLFADHDKRFAHSFTSHCSPQDIPSMMTYLGPDVTATLSHHFSQYDFELFEDKLLIYSSQQGTGRGTIDNLFRAGIWLAQELEKHASQTSPA